VNNFDRKALIESLIIGIQNKKSPSKHEMQQALTAEEWDKYEARVRSYWELPKLSRYAINSLQPYEKALKRADFLDARANACSGKRRPRFISPLYRKTPLSIQADNAYERALEILQQLLEKEPGMVGCFDRPIKFDIDDLAPRPDVVSVPRRITSRSQHALHEGHAKQTMGGLKLDALQKSLGVLEAEFAMAPTGMQAGGADWDEPDWSDYWAEDFGLWGAF
jgi:hypothetical protein